MKIFEGPVFDMTQKYADLFMTVFLTCFYASAFPIGVLISIVGLIFGYWTDKVFRESLNGFM